MKIFSFFLLMGLLSFFNPNVAKADHIYHAVGSIKATQGGQPCVLSYDLTITYEIVWGIPPIQVTSVTGTVSGCGYNVQIGMAVPTYGDGDPSQNQDPNQQNTITAVNWLQGDDQSALDYLNSSELQSDWCNEFNNVIVPAIMNQN